MRKILSIFFVLILLVSTTGIKVYEHFCFGEFVNSGLTSTSCCTKSTCCSTKEKVFKVLDSYERQQQDNLQLSIAALSYIVPAFFYVLPDATKSLAIADAEFTYYDTKPPLSDSKKKFVALEVFRI